jgi:hypothetical protein
MNGMIRPEHHELMARGEIPKKWKPNLREDHARN